MPWIVAALGHTSRYHPADSPEREYRTKAAATFAAALLTLRTRGERYIAAEAPPPLPTIIDPRTRDYDPLLDDVEVAILCREEPPGAYGTLVRLTHEPTGIVVESNDYETDVANMERAVGLLRDELRGRS